MRIGRLAGWRRALLLLALLPLCTSQSAYDFETQPINPSFTPRGYQPPPQPTRYPVPAPAPSPRFQPHQSVGYQPPPQPALYETSYSQPSRAMYRPPQRLAQQHYERPAHYAQEQPSYEAVPVQKPDRPAPAYQEPAALRPASFQHPVPNYEMPEQPRTVTRTQEPTRPAKQTPPHRPSPASATRPSPYEPEPYQSTPYRPAPAPTRQTQSPPSYESETRRPVHRPVPSSYEPERATYQPQPKHSAHFPAPAPYVAEPRRPVHLPAPSPYEPAPYQPEARTPAPPRQTQPPQSYEPGPASYKPDPRRPTHRPTPAPYEPEPAPYRPEPRRPAHHPAPSPYDQEPSGYNAQLLLPWDSLPLPSHPDPLPDHHHQQQQRPQQQPDQTRQPPAIAPTGSFGGPVAGSQQPGGEGLNVMIHVFINEKLPAGAPTEAPGPIAPPQPLPPQLAGMHFPHSSMPLTFTRDFDRNKNRFLTDAEEKVEEQQEGPANIVEIKAVVDSSDAAMDMRIGQAMAKELDRAVPVILGKLPDRTSRLNEGLRNQLEQELISEISKNLGERLEQSPSDVSETELTKLIQEGLEELEKETPGTPATRPSTVTRPTTATRPTSGPSVPHTNSQQTQPVKPPSRPATTAATTRLTAPSAPATTQTERPTVPPSLTTRPSAPPASTTQTERPTAPPAPTTRPSSPPAPQKTTEPTRPPALTTAATEPTKPTAPTATFEPAATTEAHPPATAQAPALREPAPPATEAAASRPTQQTQRPTAVPSPSTVQWWTPTTKAPSTAETEAAAAAAQQHHAAATTEAPLPPVATMHTFPTESVPLPVTQPTLKEPESSSEEQFEEIPFEHKGAEFPTEATVRPMHESTTTTKATRPTQPAIPGTRPVPTNLPSIAFSPPTISPGMTTEPSETTKPAGDHSEDGHPMSLPGIKPTTPESTIPATGPTTIEKTSEATKPAQAAPEPTKATTHPTTIEKTSEATEPTQAAPESTEATIVTTTASEAKMTTTPSAPSEETTENPTVTETTPATTAPGMAEGTTQPASTDAPVTKTKEEMEAEEVDLEDLISAIEGELNEKEKIKMESSMEKSAEETTSTSSTTTTASSEDVSGEESTTTSGSSTTTSSAAEAKSGEEATTMTSTATEATSKITTTSTVPTATTTESEVASSTKSKSGLESELSTELSKELTETSDLADELSETLSKELIKSEETELEKALSQELEKNIEDGKSIETLIHEGEMAFEKLGNATEKSKEDEDQDLLAKELEKELGKDLEEPSSSEKSTETELGKALSEDLDKGLEEPSSSEKSTEADLVKALSEDLGKKLAEGKSIETLIREGEEALKKLEGEKSTEKPEVTKKPDTDHEEMPFMGKDAFGMMLMSVVEKGQEAEKPKTTECSVPRNLSDTTKADVLFLLDSSSAFNEEKFKGALELIANTTGHFSNIGPEGVQVSLIQFASEPQLEFSLRRHNCLPTLIEDIKGTEYLKGHSLLGHAIDKATRLAFTRERGDRLDAENLLIIVTDAATEDKVQQPVMVARENGVDVLVISTFEADPEVVLELAGAPENIFKMDGKLTEPLSTKLAQRIRDDAAGYHIPEQRFPVVNENKDESAEEHKKGEEGGAEKKPNEGATTELPTTLKSGEVTQEMLPPPRNLKLACTRKSMGINIELPGAFHGWLFIEGQREKENCSMKVEKDESKEFRHVHFEADIDECDIAHIQSESPAGINSSAVVSIVKHPKAVSIDDKAFLLECFVASALETTLDAHLEVVGGIKKTIAEAFSLDVVPPKCHYTIRKGSPEGAEVVKADLGEVVFHRWDCDGGDDAYDVFGMHIHDCYASSDIAQQFPILDKIGCSSNVNLLGQPVYADGALSVYAESRAFAVENDQQDLKFQCKVSLCTRDGDGCEGITPPACSGGNATDLLVSRRLRHNQAADFALTSAVATSVGLTTAAVSRYSPALVILIAIILATAVGLISAVRLKSCRSRPSACRPIVTSPSMEDIYVTVPGRTSVRTTTLPNPSMTDFMKNFDRSRYV